MFDSVSQKLRIVGYFLSNLKSLEKEVGGFAHIKREKFTEMRANLDGFFFEVISAKEFFLQNINDKYSGGLPGEDATKLDKLLASPLAENAKEQIRRIQQQISKKYTWLWSLNNYRNTVAHRRLFQRGFEAEFPPGTVKVYLFKDPNCPEEGNADTEIIPYCEGALKQMTEFLEELYLQL